ncbi:MAG: hypothetical protein ACI8XB_003300 [Patiriisocius sp.]|jgi:hypothetical protein
MRLLFQKHTFYLAITLFVVSCSGMRTDGSLNFDGEMINMVYFNTNDQLIIIDHLVKDFGQYETTKYKKQIVWPKIEKKEWSDAFMRMKVMWYSDYTGKNESFSIAIIDYNNKVITDRHSRESKIIKDYLKEILKNK